MSLIAAAAAANPPHSPGLSPAAGTRCHRHCQGRDVGTSLADAECSPGPANLLHCLVHPVPGTDGATCPSVLCCVHRQLSLATASLHVLVMGWGQIWDVLREGPRPVCRGQGMLSTWSWMGAAGAVCLVPCAAPKAPSCHYAGCWWCPPLHCLQPRGGSHQYCPGGALALGPVWFCRALGPEPLASSHPQLRQRRWPLVKPRVLGWVWLDGGRDTFSSRKCWHQPGCGAGMEGLASQDGAGGRCGAVCG